mmetsp:Transcript_44584/g.80150  ORF Transcript_44584/g.80150 Transcript_44584/m.80150 type:complete len:547 (-) Transcript_44584:66-1706(-)
MASVSDEDGVGYDDDFEEEDLDESDDNVKQVLKPVTAASTAAPSTASTPCVPQASRPGRRRRPGDEDSGPQAPATLAPAPVAALPAAPSPNETPRSRGSRRSVEGMSAMVPIGDQDSRMPGRLGSAGAAGYEVMADGRTGSSSSQRVVRGKVSVASEDRPGTGESMASNQQAPPVKDTRPLWLQNDASKPIHRSRPPLDPESSTPRGGLGGRARPGSRNVSERGMDILEVKDSGDDDRKNKRLQQEIQRLSQRLAESEMYSAQDDGLPKFRLEDVEEGLMIAQGGFASVHHATWQCTPCALKKIFDPILTDELKTEFENEVRMLRKLRHPNVVTLMAVCRTPPALSILTEYVLGGSLFEVLHSAPGSRPRGSLEPEPGVLLPLVQQASMALAYLHAMQVVHRDIKSQNVLLSDGSKPIAKLCDFGLARMTSELCTGSMQWAGTAPYMAPELWSKRRYDETVDTFAFGTMVWEVVSQEIPHCNMDAADISHRIQNKEAAGLTMVHSWPKSLKTLIRNMVSVQTDQRPPMKDVVKHLGGIIQEFPLHG